MATAASDGDQARSMRPFAHVAAPCSTRLRRRAGCVVALSAATAGVLALGPDSLGFAVAIPQQAIISFGATESATEWKVPWWSNGFEARYYDRNYKYRVPGYVPLPGGVDRPTRREQAMRWKLRKKFEIDPSEFDRLIQVFAQRARQDLKYNGIQRREFIRRAKRWTGEMVLQGMQPRTLSMKIILLGCAATGDSMGAAWWLRWMERNNYPIGRFEYNAMVDTFATEGLPEQAEEWIEKMQQIGITPDARTYASVVKAWCVVGNRKRMLMVMNEVRQREDAGELGEPLDPDDVSLPYYACAKSYVPSGDSPRVMSILKSARDRGIPMTREAHQIRLATQYRLSDRKPLVNPEEVAKAFDAILDYYKPGEPLFDERIRDFVWDVLTESDVLDAILEKHAMLNNPEINPKEDLTFKVTPLEEVKKYHTHRHKVAAKTGDGGRQLLRNINEDALWFRNKIKMKRGPKMGKIYGGRREPGPDGLPEWMTINSPEKFG